jgi:starch synthase
MSKVLFVSSEAHPLVKTGGLADVSGSLPAALKSQRCSIRLLLPAYPAAKAKLGKLRTIATLQIPGTPGDITLLEGRLPDSKVITWLMDYPPAFDRPGNPYQTDTGHDWPDNAERFALFCRVASEIALGRVNLKWIPEIVHCNDWQSGLVPALLQQASRRPATVFTVHNLAYQGLFPRETFFALGLPGEMWTHEGLEFHDQLSFIKGGLAYADRITTVSPSYAQEIQQPAFGCGLDGLLRYRQARLHGILNGIDEEQWNPKTDPLIAQNYDVKTLKKKAVNKQELQHSCGLPQLDDHLLLGLVGRLVEQKGVDLILQAMDQLMALPIQMVMLGSGTHHFEEAFQAVAQRYPDRFHIKVGYDEALAHNIEAGADAFLMPSRFEPCGLNQMYSLRYGTLPIVHAVGGLADTVVNAEKETMKAKTATGFSFQGAEAEPLAQAVTRAVAMYQHPKQWRQLMKTAMEQSFGWHQSAKAYLQIYSLAANDNPKH